MSSALQSSCGLRGPAGQPAAEPGRMSSHKRSTLTVTLRCSPCGATARLHPGHSSFEVHHVARCAPWFAPQDDGADILVEARETRATPTNVARSHRVNKKNPLSTVARRTLMNQPRL